MNDYLPIHYESLKFSIFRDTVKNAKSYFIFRKMLRGEEEREEKTSSTLFAVYHSGGKEEKKEAECLGPILIGLLKQEGRGGNKERGRERYRHRHRCKHRQRELQTHR